MGKQKGQELLILKEANSGAEFANSEAGLCALLHKEELGWEINSTQQARHEKTGILLQIVSELNKQPLQIFKYRPITKGRLVTDIAGLSFDRELTSIRQENQKNSMLLWLAIIVVTLALTTGLIVYFNMR